MFSQQEIQDILLAKVRKAQERQREAGKRFRQLTGDIPSLIPAPDGALRIQQAGADYRASLRDLKHALNRYDQFVERGVVPADLAQGWRIL